VGKAEEFTAIDYYDFVAMFKDLEEKRWKFYCRL